MSGYPALPPPPVPPVFAKQEIYMDPVVFAEVDQRAISIAQEDQKTFTDLVRQLGSAHSPVQLSFPGGFPEFPPSSGRSIPREMT